MAKIIGLPKLSPTMEEGVLLEWTKKEGDAVEVDDLLAEVETDKATMEFRSFDRGVILKLLVGEGESLAPDTPVAIIGEQGEDISALLEQVSASGSSGEPSDAAGSSSASSDTTAAAPEVSAAPKPAPKITMKNRSDGRVFASPLVRRLAREQNIDLAGVEGTGPRGRVIKRDLEGVSGGGAVTTFGGSGVVGSGAGYERLAPRVEQASNTRKTIARRLTESKQEVPHFYLTIDVDARPIVAARKSMNAALAASGEKVSFNDIILKVTAMALRNFPNANASWVEGEIHYHQVVDLSVAVAIDDGLITPVIRDADRKGILEISREMRELADRARNKKLRLEEFTGGTFSVSNLGGFGIEEFSAVINPPEGAILAVGRIRDDVIVDGGEVVAGKKMKVTLSCDHRVIDGAVGAQWLAEFQRLMEKPFAMLL